MKRRPKKSPRRSEAPRSKGANVQAAPTESSLPAPPNAVPETAHKRPAPQVLKHSGAFASAREPTRREPSADVAPLAEGDSPLSPRPPPASGSSWQEAIVTQPQAEVALPQESSEPALAARPLTATAPGVAAQSSGAQPSIRLARATHRPIWPMAFGAAVLAVLPLLLAALPSTNSAAEANARLQEEQSERGAAAIEQAAAVAEGAAAGALERVERHVRARTLGHTLAASAPRIALHVVENTMAAPRVWAEVEEGENWQDIAARFGHSGTMLATLNPDTDLNELTPGQRLLVHRWSPELPSVSVGQPNRGRLLNGVPMPDGQFWRVRDPNLAYGTDYAVSHLMRGLAYVGEQYPGGAVPMIGDLSRQRGGRLKRHRSHRSGRDADVAYYFHNHVLSDNFTHATTATMDTERQWALFEYWLERDLVIYIFIDPRLQRALRRYAMEQEVDQEMLDRAFGSANTGRSGVLRYSPGHRDHFHVRFRCDEDDERCEER